MMNRTKTMSRNRRGITLIAAAIGGVIGASVLTGCGAAGGVLGTLTGLGALTGTGSKTKTVPARIDISWAQRSRAAATPSSALSASITLIAADADGQDITWIVNRKPEPGAYQETIASPVGAKLGSVSVSIRFYSQLQGGGDVVGTAQQSATLQADGTGLSDIQTTGNVAYVAIVGGQTLKIGVRQALRLTATDAGGKTIALSPGAVFFTIAGDNFLKIDSDGQVEGVAAGSATVIATVDGKASAPSAITVTP